MSKSIEGYTCDYYITVADGYMGPPTLFYCPLRKILAQGRSTLGCSPQDKNECAMKYSDRKRIKRTDAIYGREGYGEDVGSDYGTIYENTRFSDE